MGRVASSPFSSYIKITIKDMNNYEAVVYKQGEGSAPTTYIVNKKGNTVCLYLSAYTAEEAIDRYKKFMK